MRPDAHPRGLPLAEHRRADYTARLAAALLGAQLAVYTSLPGARVNGLGVELFILQVFVGPRCSVAAPTYYASCALIGIICGLLGSVFNQIVLEWNFQRLA